VSDASIGALGRTVHVGHETQIDDIERVYAEIAQIVVYRAGKLGLRHGPIPRAIVTTLRTDLGDDYKVLGIGMQRFVDDLVGDMRSIVIAGVDVIDAARHRLAQPCDGDRAVLRRSEHARSRKLHRAIAQALHGALAKLECSGFASIGHGLSPVARRFR
jgi:hypothetical protein